MTAAGFRIVSGGTDNHIVLVDTFSKGITGKVAEAALGQAGITVNKNAIPFDKNPPMVASGVRLGTPAVTTAVGWAKRRWTSRRLHRARPGLAGRRHGAVQGDQDRNRAVVPEVPAVPGTPSLVSAVEAAFANGGVLARAVENFEPRAGQRAMALAVAETLNEGGVLLAEAGTGTGKTLACICVPRDPEPPARAGLHRHEEPAGAESTSKTCRCCARRSASPVKATYMKGRANYLCLHRLDRAWASPRRASRLRVDGVTSGGTGHRNGRPLRAARPAGRLVAVARRLGHRRDLPRQRAARSTRSVTSPRCVSAPRKPTW